MRVFHDDAGSILFQIDGDTIPDQGLPFLDIEGEVDIELYRVADGALVLRDDAVPLRRVAAIATVNRIAGEVRSRFVTVIPGQEMIYLIKEAEARGWLADPAPDLADYPFVAAEIGITGADGDEVAQVYANLAAILRATAAQLETARLGTIAAIEGATTLAAIEGAIAAYQAALEAFG